MEIFTYNDFFRYEDILTSEINNYIMDENSEYLYEAKKRILIIGMTKHLEKYYIIKKNS